VRVEGPSSGDREVTGGHTPALGTGGALNGTHLDRDLDQSRAAPAEADAVEAALAGALSAAAVAGRFDVVAQLARELEARRFARAGNVFILNALGGKKEGA
jgi:hypothetical protein